MGKEQDKFVKRQWKIVNSGGRPSKNFPGLNGDQCRELDQIWALYVDKSGTKVHDKPGKESHTGPRKYVSNRRKGM